MTISTDVWWIITSLGATCTVVLGWLLKNAYTAQTNKLTKMELEITKIKENYLDRFEKMNVNITSSKEEIIEKLHQIELSSAAKTAAQLIENTAVAVAIALKEKR